MNQRTPTLLIVEDDIELCEVMAELFRNKGFDVVTSYHEKDAMRRITNQKFDCIVLDIYLQGTPLGEEVLQQMRSDRRGYNCQSPVLIVSGRVDHEMVVALQDQVQGIVVKPYQPEELFTKVKAIVDREMARVALFTNAFVV